MSNIRINDFPSRLQFTYAGGTPVFVINFPFFENTDLFVYLSDPADNFEQEDPLNLLTLGVDYTVTGAGLNTGGTVTLTASPTVGFTVTIVGRMPIDRFSIYENSSVISMAQLNEDFNRIVVMLKNIDTIIEQTMPKYDRSEYVQTARSQPDTPFSYVNLPMLDTNEAWVGNQTATGLTKLFIGGAGTGNVLSSGPGMRPSIALWTGTDFILTDSDLYIDGAQLTPVAGIAEDVTGFTDDWAAFHWPSHVTGSRPSIPVDGDTYYDTTLNQFFGYENGVWVPFATGSAGGDDLIKRTITQVDHELEVTDYVYIDAAGLYQEAMANTQLTSEVQGLVVEVIDDDNFVLQTAGYVDAGVFTGLTTGRVYFLSDNVLGKHSLDEPVTNGFVSLPVFWAESPTTGWLRHSRGFVIGGEPAPDGEGGDGDTSTTTITQVNHGFVAQDWLYVSANQTYAKGIATSLTTSQVVGVVIQVIDADTFRLQQSGRLQGIVTQDGQLIPQAIVSSTIYYLSNITPGRLMPAPSVNIGDFTKPLWVQDDLALNAGWILEQRPLPITAPSGAGAEVLIQTFTLNNGDMTFDSGANLFDGTYRDIRIVGRGITVADGTGNQATNALKMRLYTNGVLRSAAATYRIFSNPNTMPFTNAHLFRTNFGVLNGTFGTVNGGTFQFESKIQNVPSTTKFKYVYQTNIADQHATNSIALPPNAVVNITDKSNNTAGVSVTENDSWLYIGDTLAITGFYLFFDYPVGANTSFFTGGEISVYGTVA